MNYLLKLLFISYLINSSFSLRRHNTKEEDTKILDKIKPNSDLCNEENCPIERGTCSGENFCFCFDGYISSFKSFYLCDYQQKDRLVYFLLEFFIGFGIGHLYVGNYIFAAIKIICYSVLFGLYFFKYMKMKGIDAARIRFFIWVIVTIWQTSDGFCIFRGIFTDGNDMPTGFRYV